MRFTLITALCAAPLALAGSLQEDLYARGAMDPEVGLMRRDIDKSSSKKGSVKDASNNNGSPVVIEQAAATEIIIIWANQGGGAATQTVTTTSTVTQAGAAAQATHSVVVGGTAGLVYSPDTIEANIGDMVIFSFQSNNHTATQSAFTTPCEKLAGGMDSGFMPNVNNTVSPPPQVAMQVAVDTPIWFYCRQTGHCGKGMTFSINPTANKTQQMFQSMAIAQNGTGTTAPIAGGSAAPATASAAAPSGTAAAAGSSSSLASGTGTLENGQCACSCLCGQAAFPNAAVQGISGFGGMSGSIPMSSLEA